MSWRRPARLGPEAAELLDEGAGTPEEEADAYRLLEQVNIRLGGYRASERALELLWRGRASELRASEGSAHARPLVFLDIAGGDGAFAERLLAWTEARGEPARAITLDRNPQALARARRRPGVAALRADALGLPLRDGAVDCAHCSAFFHHLGVEQARALLAEMCRVSRRAVVVNDLVRSWVATGAIWALARTLTDNRLVRYDGPLSVRKSFVPRELVALAHAAAATEPAARAFRWRLLSQFPYRMSLVGIRTP